MVQWWKAIAKYTEKNEKFVKMEHEMYDRGREREKVRICLPLLEWDFWDRVYVLLKSRDSTLSLSLSLSHMYVNKFIFFGGLYQSDVCKCVFD